MRYRRFSADLDDYVELEQPVPWTREMLAETRREMHKAWLAEQTGPTVTPFRLVRPAESTRPASVWGEDE